MSTIGGYTLLLITVLLLIVVKPTATTSCRESSGNCVPDTEHYLYYLTEFSLGPFQPGGISPFL